MEKKLDEMHAAYERLISARVRFEQVSRMVREGSGADFTGLVRALDELNVAQQSFSDAAAKVVKGSLQRLIPVSGLKGRRFKLPADSRGARVGAAEIPADFSHGRAQLAGRYCGHDARHVFLPLEYTQAEHRGGLGRDWRSGVTLTGHANVQPR